MEALVAAVARWRSWRHESEAKWNDSRFSADAPSCLQITIHVGHDRDNLDRCVNDLGELLRIVELLTRAGVDPLALHWLVGHRDIARCPLGGRWCRFCDGADRRVELALCPVENVGRSDTPPYLTVVRRAVFEWDDATAITPSFPEIRAAVDRIVLAPLREATARPPLELQLVLWQKEERSSEPGVVELEALLDRCVSPQDASNVGLFQIASTEVVELTPELAARVAASQLPMHIRHELYWKQMVNESADRSGPRPSALVTGNVTMLQAWAPSHDCPFPQVERLYETLYSHASQLKDLAIVHEDLSSDDGMDSEDEDATGRTKEIQVIARGLFGPDTTLRLDRLSLSGPISETDLQRMIAAVAPPALGVGATDSREVRHRSVTLRSGKLSTVHGATLADLLVRAGGVTSLELGGPPEEGFRIAQIRDLAQGCASLRELVVDTSCIGWKKLLPLSAADGAPSGSHLERLELQIHDRKPALIASAVERLLSHVGRSLVSLCVFSWRARATLKPAVATAIVQRCPHLEELAVRNAGDDFVQQLLEAYSTRPCRLARLTLVTGHAEAEYNGLVAALSAREHALARVLRSLHVDVRGWDDADVNALAKRLQQLLRTNDRLRDLTLCISEGWRPDVDADADAAVEEWSVHPPPLRHRLAALSVLRAFRLPMPIAASILSMTGRPVRRFRLEMKADDNDSEDEDED